MKDIVFPQSQPQPGRGVGYAGAHCRRLRPRRSGLRRGHPAHQDSLAGCRARPDAGAGLLP
ncbi:MAG: hypothetical protein C4293_21115, partial [Nitrospiraceae bacterium]